MNILHISDFHYNGDSRISNRVLPAITKVLNDSGQQIDFVLFTGDLVFSGTSKKKFEEGRVVLFDYLCKELNVSQDNLIFCPGNHDIDRESIHEGVLPYIKDNIKNNEDLNKFYSKPPKFLLEDSLRPLANYVEFARGFHKENNENIYKNLYSVHYRKLGNSVYAFVCLYTPWLCGIGIKNDILDYGNIYYPEPIFDEISKEIGGKADKKVVLLHHPISFLKDFNAYEIENHIYNEFDMCFVGHVHKMQNMAIHNGTNGIYEHVAKASLSDKTCLGCSFICMDDIEDNIFNVSEITYVPDSNECLLGTPVVVTIPIGKEKEEKNKLRRKLFDKIAIEKTNANNLLLVKAEEGGKDFLTSFSSPHIKTSKEDAMNASLAPIVPLTDLFNTENSIFIFGKDKCGKSSLLRRIQLEYLMNYTSYGKIPLFIDANEEEHIIDDNYSIDDKVRSYLGLSKKSTTEITESEQLVLLIDNFKVETGFSNYLKSFVLSHPQCVFFATMDDSLSNTIGLEKLDLGKDYSYGMVYFHDLRKQEIIKYTEKQLSEKDDKKVIQEKILKLCKQMALPYNYWTVSLFLLIHQKSSDTYSKNLYSILDVCVDEIFGKKRLLIQNANISFEQLKSVCASLAAYLFENHEASIYSAKRDEIINFLRLECEKNIRITADPEAIFNFYEACGMLKRKADDRLVFRLNGFFEYFLACQMTKDTAFKDRILSDDVKYLGFKNQLEIYSGFRHNDTNFLKLVFDKTESKCAPIFSRFSDDKDRQLLSTIELPTKLEDKCREISIKNALSSVKRAEVEDMANGSVNLKSEVHLMQRFDPTSNKPEIISRHLTILARVFKNIDECHDKELDLSEIFKTIVDNYCDYSFYLVDEFSKEAEGGIDRESFTSAEDYDELKLLKLLSYFSPLLAQVELFDGLGHYSLVRLIEEEICRLRENVDRNQYRLFVLYFLLLDIALDEYYKEYIDMAIADLNKIPLLRYMLYLKINYYIGFKSNGNKDMEQYLSNKAQQVKLLLDNKTDIGSIQKGLAGTKKNALINRNK